MESAHYLKIEVQESASCYKEPSLSTWLQETLPPLTSSSIYILTWSPLWHIILRIKLWLAFVFIAVYLTEQRQYLIYIFITTIHDKVSKDSDCLLIRETFHSPKILNSLIRLQLWILPGPCRTFSVINIGLRHYKPLSPELLHLLPPITSNLAQFCLIYISTTFYKQGSTTSKEQYRLGYGS